MVRSTLLLTLAGLLALAWSAPQGGRTIRNGSRVNRFSLGDSIMRFHSKFYGQVTQKNLGNIFYSPFSIHMLVSQLLLGSPVNSSTHSELDSLLELDEDQSYLTAYQRYRRGQEDLLKRLHKGSVVRIANSMYSADGWNIKHNFSVALEKFFFTDMNEVDFSDGETVAKKINQFVQNKTNNLIQKLFEPDDFDALTRMVLLNAVYFKGSWKHPFDKDDTRQSVFFVDDNRQTNFSAMQTFANAKNINLPELKSRALQLPYQNEKTAMVVILPDREVGVQEVESRLENFDLKVLFQNLSLASPTEDVNIILPKFEAEFTVEGMNEMLTNLGVSSIFNPWAANFSEISDEPDLYVSKIAHKAIVKVNEEGSEAAAVTDAVVGVKIYDESKVFLVNRPFLFFIVDLDNKLPLFAGRIIDPNGKLTLTSDKATVPTIQDPDFASPRSVDVGSAQGAAAAVTTDYPCIHLGYFPNDPAYVSYPCPGHDTINLELHNAGQAETRKKFEDYKEQINSLNLH